MSTIAVEAAEMSTRPEREAQAQGAVVEGRSAGSRVRQLLGVFVALVVVAGIGAMLIA